MTDISKEAVEWALRALFVAPKGVDEFVDVQEIAYAQAARIAELEAALATARADALREAAEAVNRNLGKPAHHAHAAILALIDKEPTT